MYLLQIISHEFGKSLSTANSNGLTKRILKARDKHLDATQIREDELLGAALHASSEAARREAISSLLEREYEWLKRIAMLLARESELGNDALQEALFEIARSLPRFRNDSSLRTWMFVIVRRCVQKASRKRWLREARYLLGKERDVAEKSELQETSLGPDTLLLGREAQKNLWRLVEKLPEKQRLSVLLYYGEELSVSEIAKALSCSESSVKTHLARAREKLRESVSAEFEGAVSPVLR